ncbi:zeta toxin-domain-containing protein [Corynascus novoguineensis]|uniref:Zeta toxin-domain-containing protein n=1 Tax=Corynascus novoguineensis TaxID=1126955 RepID=A0AAN7CYZ2_9PEZI|nr:zeta toxin-domain-containing protein [Corynascus novoguineensis]
MGFTKDLLVQPPVNAADEDARLLASWQISPETHDHILRTRIIPTELGPFLSLHEEKSNENSNSNKKGKGTRPRAILILGQTGAGKTYYTPHLLSTLVDDQIQEEQQQNQDEPSSHSSSGGSRRQRREPAVLHLIADTYKTYHPNFATCLASPRHAHLASRLASAAAARWLHAVCERAASPDTSGTSSGAGIDPIVVEAAARRPADFQALVRVFSKAGYDVRVVVLAVPAALSRLGIAHKEGDQEEGKSRGMPLRFTPRAVHDASFDGVEAVRGEEAGGGQLVDRFVMLRRGGGVVYSNERTERGWVKEAAALRALERERTRALTEEERRTATEDIRMLKGLKDPKVDKEVEEIEKLMAGLGTGDGMVLETVPFDAFEFVKREG